MTRHSSLSRGGRDPQYVEARRKELELLQAFRVSKVDAKRVLSALEKAKGPGSMERAGKIDALREWAGVDQAPSAPTLPDDQGGLF